MSARWDDTNARLQRMLDGLTTAQVALLDVQRALFAERESHEAHRVILHDGSAIPDDIPTPPGCQDEPPEVR